MIYDDILKMVGDTPIVKLRNNFNLPVEFFVKLEGNNPTGSIKDRAALALILDKMNTGQLQKDMTILDASSGSYACSIAYFGKIFGYPVTVVTGSKLTKDKHQFINYFDAELISYGDFTIEGNKYCKETICAQEPERYCFLDQLHNWENPRNHFVNTAPEIFRDIPDLDLIVFSLGSGGTLHGICTYIRDQNLKTKIIAVTSESETKIPGVGAFVDGDYITPFIAESRNKNFFNFEVRVSFHEAIKQVNYLRQEGLYVGPQTGSVFNGAIKVLKRNKIQGKVLLISGDSGWKNMQRLVENICE